MQAQTSQLRLLAVCGAIQSNSVGSELVGVEIRLRLAGVKPNSEAIRIMISA